MSNGRGRPSQPAVESDLEAVMYMWSTSLLADTMLVVALTICAIGLAASSLHLW